MTHEEEVEAVRKLCTAIAAQAAYDYVVLRKWNLITETDEVNITAWPRRRDGMFRYVLDAQYSPAECAILLKYLQHDSIARLWSHRAFVAVQNGKHNVRSEEKTYHARKRYITSWLPSRELQWLRKEAARVGGIIVSKKIGGRIYYAVKV